MSVRYEDLIGLWQEGQRRLREAAPADRPALERVVDELVVQLRRRLGGPFTVVRARPAVHRAGNRLVLRRGRAGRAQHPGGLGSDHGAGRRLRALRARGERLHHRAPSAPTAEPRPIVVVVGVRLAGAADHDLILLDRHLDGPVAGPVLGVDGIVLDGGIEPQSVALLAVVEGRLQRAGGAAAAAASASAAAAATAAGRLVGASSSSSSSSVSARRRRPRRRRRARRRSAHRPRRAGRSRRRSRRRGSAFGVVAGLERLLALESLDLLNGDLQLVGDPGVGASLADPGADSVELRSE